MMNLKIRSRIVLLKHFKLSLCFEVIKEPLT